MARQRSSAATARTRAETGSSARPALRSVAGGAPAELPRGRGRPRITRLSGRERGVLEGLARGETTEEVAEALRVSPHTVRTHIKNALRKLGARTRAHAVAIAISEGAIEL